MTSTPHPVPDLGQYRPRSLELFERASSIFPSGVTRATIEAEPFPVFVSFGEGAHVTDADGHRLLDLNNNFTTLIHGHAYPPIVEAVTETLRQGTCFANPMEHEIELAELLSDRIPAVEQLRFVTSGTEAVMFAIKAARAATGRSGIARIEGAYHGAYDWAEVGQGLKDGRPAGPSDGTPQSVSEDIVVIEFNNVVDLNQKIERNASRLAAILIDPMPSRAGLIEPSADFMAAINSIARRHGILVIADEVLNLRQGFKGASARYGLEPDLVTMGKIIGGGFPVGAIGGGREIMSLFARQAGKPSLFQGGTFSANPVSMVAGRVAMEEMDENAFARLEMLGERVRAGLNSCIARHSARFCITGAASLFRVHAKRSVPTTYRESIATPDEMDRLKRLQRHFLNNGILLPYGAAASLSTPMTERDIDQIVLAFDEFLISDQALAGEAA